jgi:hypothetical protein
VLVGGNLGNGRAEKAWRLSSNLRSTVCTFSFNFEILRSVLIVDVKAGVSDDAEWMGCSDSEMIWDAKFVERESMMIQPLTSKNWKKD